MNLAQALKHAKLNNVTVTILALNEMQVGNVTVSRPVKGGAGTWSVGTPDRNAGTFKVGVAIYRAVEQQFVSKV